MSIHKAAPASDNTHCAVCGQHVRRVPGGHGPAWIHADSGAVAAPNPPSPEDGDSTYEKVRAALARRYGEDMVTDEVVSEVIDALRLIR